MHGDGGMSERDSSNTSIEAPKRRGSQKGASIGRMIAEQGFIAICNSTV